MFDPHGLLTAPLELLQHLDLAGEGAHEFGGHGTGGKELRDLGSPLGTPKQFHGEPVGHGKLARDGRFEFGRRRSALNEGD
jgi:hypothetical protein